MHLKWEAKQWACVAPFAIPHSTGNESDPCISRLDTPEAAATASSGIAMLCGAAFMDAVDSGKSSSSGPKKGKVVVASAIGCVVSDRNSNGNYTTGKYTEEGLIKCSCHQQEVAVSVFCKDHCGNRACYPYKTLLVHTSKGKVSLKELALADGSIIVKGKQFAHGKKDERDGARAQKRQREL